MKTLTLDEWKAQQKKEAPKFNLRKAGEGSDIDPKWKKATSYKKVNEEQSEDEEEETVSFFLLLFLVMIKIGTTDLLKIQKIVETEILHFPFYLYLPCHITFYLCSFYRLYTYRGQIDRKSWTSTSPSLTKIPGVEVEEVVDVAAAVDVVEKEESSVSAVRDQMVSAAKDKKATVHQGRREMLLPVVEEIVEAVVVEVIAEAEEEEAINKSLALLRKLSLPWDRSIKVLVINIIQPVIEGFNFRS